MKWNVRLAYAAQNQLLNIKDSRIRGQIRKHIDGLEHDPDKQGKSLGDDLYGYRSIKIIKQRYRIIYKLKNNNVTVLVVGMGIRKEGDRKDVYALAIKLARLGLLDRIDLQEDEPASDVQLDESTQIEGSDQPETAEE